ncbi:hypothetical protein [Nonomuraea sp. NPDC049480]|uniref:hypothetical protein n=1 Tax=Nonomuraea sp. NPDC049480 TaxID=3364353 RepID=UPI0037A00D46
MNQSVSKILLFAMATVLLTATAGTARADATGNAFPCEVYPHACNLKTQLLKPNPKDNWADGRITRTIYLAAGRYSLHYAGCTDHATQSAWLPEGTYSWRDQLDPKNGYYHQSVVLDGPVDWSRGTCDWQVHTEGNYEWGTHLTLLL